MEWFEILQTIHLKGLTFDPAIPLLSIYPKGKKTPTNSKRYLGLPWWRSG